MVDMNRPRRRKVQAQPEEFSGAENQVADVLKNTYKFERNRHISNQRIQQHAYEPGKWHADDRESTSVSENIEDAQSAKKLDVWVKIARFVLSNELDPETFIRRQFHALHPDAKPPMPTQIGGPSAMVNYELGREVSYDQIRIAFISQSQLARRHMALEQSSEGNNHEIWAEVLEDEDIPLSALFRYCLAASTYKKTEDAIFKDTADLFLQTGALQYLQDPEAYNELWGKDWIPEGFQDKARGIYRRFYGIEQEKKHGR